MKKLVNALLIVLLLASSSFAFEYTHFGHLFGTNSWDYTPSWMADPVVGKDRMWWGSDRHPDVVPGEGDVIMYNEAVGGVWGTPRIVMTPNMSGWEGRCTCDPAVVRGSFTYNGQSYGLAMYYTATDDCTDDNKIGVAFSNDGINWVKNSSNPIITGMWPNSGRYGAGQSQVQNYNGGSGIRMWYTDTPPNGPARTYEVTSTDGINFGAPTPLSTSGIVDFSLGKMMGGAIAFSPSADYLYCAFSNIHMQLITYRIPTAQRFTGTWQQVDTILPSEVGPSTDVPHLFEAGFRTDAYGNLSNTTYPGIWIAFAAGWYDLNKAVHWELYQAGGQ